MRGPALLALRQLAHDRVRTALLAGCLALSIAIPATTLLQTRAVARRLHERADATPLVVGPIGSTIDLTLHALYFQPAPERTMRFAEVARAGENLDATVVPIYGRATAGGFPLVGTTLDYFDVRDLRFREGDRFARWGDCVLGADVAERTGLAVGGRLLSDAKNRFDLAGDYPLAMRVVGILEPTGGPDDSAVFADLSTAWIVDGIGHGHEDATKVEEEHVLKKGDGSVAIDSGVTTYVEITEENVDSFHFHGDPGERPLTCLLVFPRDDRAATLLLGRYRGHGDLQATRTIESIDRLAAAVFRVQGLLATMTATLSAIGLACMGFAFALSLRMRRREFETLAELGASRASVATQIALEAAGLALVAIILAAAAAWAFDAWAAPYVERFAIGFFERSS